MKYAIVVYQLGTVDHAVGPFANKAAAGNYAAGYLEEACEDGTQTQLSLVELLDPDGNDE